MNVCVPANIALCDLAVSRVRLHGCVWLLSHSLALLGVAASSEFPA